MLKCFFFLVLIFAIFVGFTIFQLNNFHPNFNTNFETDLSERYEINYNLKENIKIFQKALSFKTLTHKNEEEFIKLKEHLKESFPLFHEKLEYKKFEKGNMFFWRGTDEKLNKEPLLLLAHLDVVPVENPKKWKTDPFEGKIIDDVIYGRGAIDDKNALIPLMSAAEILLKDNFKPKRTIIFAFGEDEETGNGKGAKNMGNYLEKEGYKPLLSLDEGGFFVKGIFEKVGIHKDTVIAIIGTTEKGYSNLNISVTCPPGHSSQPDKNHCIGILSKAITNLNNYDFPSYTNIDLMQGFFESVFSQSKKIFFKIFFALFRKVHFIIDFALSKNKLTNAMIRTTVVPTLIKGGTAENVLPSFISANLNIRLHPLDSYEFVFD